LINLLAVKFISFEGYYQILCLSFNERFRSKPNESGRKTA